MDLGELTEKAVRSIDRETEPLGKGDDGIVYLINEKVVLKLHRGIRRQGKAPYFYHGSSRDSAEHEFNIGMELYQHELQVPQFYGLFEPRRSSPLNCWGIFMERITGTCYKELPGWLKKEVRRQFKDQERLIIRLDYKQIDSYSDYNTLFDRQKRKLYLYDFVRWERSHGFRQK